jgi:hypothetical protein
LKRPWQEFDDFAYGYERKKTHEINPYFKAAGRAIHPNDSAGTCRFRRYG